MNNIEQMGGFSEEKVMIGNQMQMQLAKMNGEQLDDFIEKHAEGFRQEVETHPELFSEYKEDPDTVLRKLSESLYHH